MKNVLQLIGSFHQGGSERQAVQLTRLLAENGSCRVFAAALEKEGVLLGEMKKIGLPEIPEFKLNSFYDANFFAQLQKCARFIKRNNIDIVHTHDFYTNVFGIAASRLAGVPLKIASKRETGGMRSPLQKIIEKQIFRTADKIVANSEAVKKYLIDEKVLAAKISVVYNGLDAARLTPKITDKRTICDNFGLPFDENIKFISLVANLRHAVKNQPMFLRAAQKVLQQIPDAHFVLAGEGGLKTELGNLARHLQIERNTHFIGRCAAVPELLSISRVGVSTSFAEGFSNAIIEYMLAGKPVVATRVGGAAEAVVENETGYLIDSDDDAALANRLIELLENETKAAQFGAAGRKIALRKFSLDAQLNKTLELYEI
jgi:glycosyltransferase involved in cell wall biosynthesis